VEDIGALEASLHEARAALLDAVDGVTEAEFAQATPDDASIRDLLWRTGLQEDWARRTVSLASAGRPLPAFQARPRPPVTSEVSHLLAWLEQCRRPTLALLRRLTEDDLRREFTLPDGETTTALDLLASIASHQHAHAEAVRALRGRP